MALVSTSTFTSAASTASLSGPLPSYHEATAQQDWVSLVAPYLAPSDYRGLCLVDKHFWGIFAPRLWGDLMNSVRCMRRLDSTSELSWWNDFVTHNLGGVRLRTRYLVHVLDIRGFAKDSYDFGNDRKLQTSLHRALVLLPGVRSILLDGHDDLDPSTLLRFTGSAHENPTPTTPSRQQLRTLSVAYCSFNLSRAFFASVSLRHVVYLDVSGVPGSLLPLTIPPLLMPALRILKVRCKELDNRAAATLLNALSHRLWSLDIGENNISDGIVDLLDFWRHNDPLRGRCLAQYRIDGRLETTGHGTPDYGPFIFIRESDFSGSFGHPERYYVDSPIYTRDSRDTGAPVEIQRAQRHSCLSLCRQDTPEAAVVALSLDNTVFEEFRQSNGLTHLHVSNNSLSTAGLAKWLRLSNGRLEHISCDSMLFFPQSGNSSIWSQGLKLSGIMGNGHIFRPVVSPQLRSLRIHHSLVTNLPTLELDSDGGGLSISTCLFLAETVILPRIDKACPETFTPDMNPRLKSLILTHIPRRSFGGELTRRLIRFLRLLSAQERDVQNTRPATSAWRGPEVLTGLRHLRLEFEPDVAEDMIGEACVDDNDGDRLGEGEGGCFSFFEGESERAAVAAEEVTVLPKIRDLSELELDGESGRDFGEFVDFSGRWTGKDFTIPVWIGSSSSLSPIIRNYRHLALLAISRTNSIKETLGENSSSNDIGPVTPSQVKAGAPPKSYIFHNAWCLAIVPHKMKLPTRTHVKDVMTDVIEGLRDYRLGGRAEYEQLRQESARENKTVLLGEPHWFWTGRLEVSTTTTSVQRND